MKLLKLVLAVACLAGSASATDMAMNIKLNGREIESENKASTIMMNGILVIEDIHAETNVYKGSLFLLDTKKPKWEYSNKPMFLWPWGWVWLKYVRYYEDATDVDVYLTINKNQEFGMLVELEDSAFSGIGHLSMNKHGVNQAIISSGHGAFMHANFYEDPVVTNSASKARNSIMEGSLVELEVGKMSARLNKGLTDAINKSDNDDTIEEWLNANNFIRHEESEDD
jgi:hypothetical protein